MIPYIGDLSRRDADLLRMFSEKADRILEFGCGASTQIFSAYAMGLVQSVETDPEWIERTKRNMAKLDLSPVAAVFYAYDGFSPRTRYDLIFVDGADELRLPFAMMTWPALKVGGSMLFHDTRRTVPHGASSTTDIHNALSVAESFSPEVDRVVLNQADSNITVVRKREPLLLEDWNAIEGRTPAQCGLE